MIFKDKLIEEMIRDICAEHADISKLEDSTIGYLWYLYNAGTKKGQFKIFIFVAEMNLLIAMNILSKDEMDSIMNMITSDDKENMYMAAMAIKQMRDRRIQEYGLFTRSNPSYKDINYMIHVISPETFLNKTST